LIIPFWLMPVGAARVHLSALLAELSPAYKVLDCVAFRRVIWRDWRRAYCIDIAPSNGVGQGKYDLLRPVMGSANALILFIKPTCPRCDIYHGVNPGKIIQMILGLL
jgi:hypothetical protein